MSISSKLFLITALWFNLKNATAQQEKQYLFNPPEQNKDTTGFRLNEIQLYTMLPPNFYNDKDERILFKGKLSYGFLLLKRIYASAHSNWLLGVGGYSQTYFTNQSISQGHFTSYDDLNFTGYYLSVPLHYRYLFGVNKLRAYISSGASFDIGLFARSTATYYSWSPYSQSSTGQEKVYGNDSYTSRVYLKLELGTGLSYKLSKHFSIFAGINGYFPLSIYYQSRYHSLPLAPKINAGISFY